MPRRIFSMIAIVQVCLAANLVFAQDENAVSSPESPESPDSIAKIEAAIQSYVDAFNQRDADKLANHWAPEGVYISRVTGEQISGREAMTAEFTTLFSGDSVPTLAVATESIDFVSPNVAVEHGIATVIHAEDDVEETGYSVVYVRQGGAWLIDRVTEDEIVVEYSNREKLQPLEWMIGEWVDETEDATIELNCQWTRKQNFISRTYKVTNQEGIASSGLQVIGWDPVNEGIRSWLFDSDGSFVSGTWSQKNDKWVVQSVATLADGGQGSFTSIYRPLEDGNVSWQKINRVLDGELLPSLDEVVIQRK